MMLRTIVLTLFVTPLSLSVYASSGSTDIHNSDSDYVFDTTLLKGSGLPVDDIINYISNDKIKPGVYSVDIQLNGIFLSHENVDFRVTKDSTQPCFSPALIAQLPLKDKSHRKIRQLLFFIRDGCTVIRRYRHDQNSG